MQAMRPKNNCVIVVVTTLPAGHEVCGKVLSLGNKVPEDQGPRVGDVVVVYPWPGCGQCETCSTENWQLCDEGRSTPRHSLGDEPPSTPPAADQTEPSLASFQAWID